MFAVKSSEIRNMDRHMIETVGMPSLVLMENASKSVVDVVKDQYKEVFYGHRPIVVLCGTGNNGGDGLCIARWLIHMNAPVRCVVAGSQEKFSNDAKEQFRLLNYLIESRGLPQVLFFEDEKDEESSHRVNLWMGDASLFVDALIGTGCSRTLSEKYCRLVSIMNKSNSDVIAVDVPTGINSDNGKVMGTCVKAAVTVTFCLPKLGLVLYPGSHYVGQLIVTDIGIYAEGIVSSIENPVELLDSRWFLDQISKGKLQRQQFSHKGTFGTLGIIAGDKHMLGATILSVRAAYRAGVGLVKVFADEEVSQLLIQAIPECIVVPYEKELSKDNFDRHVENFVLQTTGIVIGPGLSKSLKARHLVQKILQLDTKAVLDADALNIISEHIEWFDERVCDCVITPHIGEMSRLTGYPSEGISENTIQFAKAFSKDHRVTTVLKSARTVIVSKDQDVYLNMAGNSGLATAGSGDVLSGVIGAMIAMGKSIDDSSVYGALLHSMTAEVYADRHNEYSMTASDIIDNLWEGI